MNSPADLSTAAGHARAGETDAAVSICTRVLEEDPNSKPALRLLVAIHQRQGDFASIVAALRERIDHDATDAWARQELGAALVELGRTRDAVTAFEGAVELRPEHVELWNNLGAAQEELGDLVAARASFERAVALRPISALPYFNLGSLVAHAGDPDTAADHYRMAVSLAPDFGDAWSRLGQALRDAGSSAHAVAALRHAASLHPDSSTDHLLLGQCLHEAGQARAAIAPLARATELASDHADSWLALGHAQLESGEAGDAVTSLTRCLELDPSDASARYDLGKALAELGEIEIALMHLRLAMETANDAVRTAATQTLAVLVPGSSAESPRSVLSTRRDWARSLPRRTSPQPATPARSDRLSVGYLSSFFQHPNWMKPVWGLINAHDRSRVKVHLFADSPEADIGADYRTNPSDRFFDISRLDNRDAADRIRASQLDVLIDLNGYSRPERLGILALQPAPRIVEWFNMYATSGLDCVDYIIGDDVVLAASGESEGYVEELLRVPGSYLTFSVDHATPHPTPSPVARAKGLTFGCLASQYKLNDGVLDCWSRILAAAPSSRLLLRNRALDSESNRNHLSSRFARRGVQADRLALLGGDTHFEFLRSYDEIDVALDPFPYNGGTTTTEALWQGVPVLSFCGDRWASRTSASLLRAAGLERFIAENVDDYVAMAVRLATDSGARSELSSLRSRLRSELTHSSVCDTAEFARNMEDLYRQICSR